MLVLASMARTISSGLLCQTSENQTPDNGIFLAPSRATRLFQPRSANISCRGVAKKRRAQWCAAAFSQMFPNCCDQATIVASRQPFLQKFGVVVLSDVAEAGSRNPFQTQSHILAAPELPESLREHDPPKRGGRRESRALAAPIASCANGESTRAKSLQVQPERPDLPCATVLRLIPCSPRRDRLGCHRRRRNHLPPT